MKLVYHPNAILEREVKDVDLENPGFDPVELKTAMVEVMLASGGIGLSANQVGLDAKVFVMGDKADNATICINPTVLQYTEDTVVDVEGCLSFPNVFVKINRPKEILARYWNEKLEECTVKITGYSAKCYLHELDHLLGITMKDRVSTLKWNMATKKAKKIEKVLESRVA
jgi:peptide deformylase